MISSPQAMMHSGRAEFEAKRPRYYLHCQGRFLHWSGMFLTEKRREAWQGTIEQARVCRDRFDAAAGCRTVNVRSIVPTPMKEEAL